MKLYLYTECHVSEFDQSEFPNYHSHGTMDSTVYVTELIEFDPERTQIKITP